MNRDEKWFDKLMYIEFTINSLIANSAGKMPFELCYGLNTWTVINHLDGMYHVK